MNSTYFTDICEICNTIRTEQKRKETWYINRLLIEMVLWNKHPLLSSDVWKLGMEILFLEINVYDKPFCEMIIIFFTYEVVYQSNKL
jgi:hypothetical protein